MVHTVKPTRSQPENAATADVAGLSFLQCPQCGEPLTETANGAIRCSACHATVPADDGIIDFVQGKAATSLDNIDYDQVYAVTLKSSLDQYETIRASAGPFWPPTLGDAVEIGCGTGGFSMAILSQSPARHVVLTDVSTKMLQTCRARLERLGDSQARSLTFATYGGTEACFAANAFDTCYGTSVVHHITDVPAFLAQVHRLLKPGGRAFFMEPNLRFHRALTATTASILARWLRHATVPERQLRCMLCWMAEVHCNIVNSGEREILAEREDKHQFIAEDFEAMAQAAGFASCLSLPCGPDPTGSAAIAAYLAQCGISEQTFGLLRTQWPAAQAPHFAALQPRDTSPSYLFWLRNGQPRDRTPHRPHPPPPPPSPNVEALAPLRLWLQLQLRREGNHLAVLADGWCAASHPVKSIALAVGKHRIRLPIWLPRPDVEMHENAAGDFPPLHTLCSGFDGKLPLDAEDNPVAVQVDIVAADGRLLPVRTVSLVAGAKSVVLDACYARPRSATNRATASGQ